MQNYCTAFVKRPLRRTAYQTISSTRNKDTTALITAHTRKRTKSGGNIDTKGNLGPLEQRETDRLLLERGRKVCERGER